MIVKILCQPLLGRVGCMGGSRVLLEHVLPPQGHPLDPGLDNCVQRLNVGSGIDPKALREEVFKKVAISKLLWLAAKATRTVCLLISCVRLEADMQGHLHMAR